MITRVGFVMITPVVEFHLHLLVEIDDNGLRGWRRNKQETEQNELRAKTGNFM